MNIFFVDEDPRLAAQALVDKHVVKMIVETAQLLSTAHRLLDGVQVELILEKDGKRRKKNVWILGDDRNDVLYNVTHRNHPSAVWARTAVENYNWLADHLFALGDEYTDRYGKIHKTISRCAYELQSPPYNLREYDWTTPPSCMDEQYILGDNVVDNYRNYYKFGKAHLHKWKNGKKPDWL